MEGFHLEHGVVSIQKSKEAVCGDFYSMIEEKKAFTAVLSDGLGSGVKANILATLTAKILSTLLAKKLPLEECVYTVASTLPMCRERKLAYATFTGFYLEQGEAYLVQYDNPLVVLIRDGKSVDYPKTSLLIDSKEIYESKFALEEGDLLILLTDGVTSAGLNKVGSFGWHLDEIVQFIEGWYSKELSPQRLAALLIDAAMQMEEGENHDDMTAMVFKVMRRKAVNLLVGPPENKEEDNQILRLFFAKDGKHIICGGTTAKTVSHYLNQPIQVIKGSGTDDIPSISSIDGVDLVTEGAITLTALAKFAKAYRTNNYLSLSLQGKKDGVSLLAKALIEEATDINIFFGRAINDAYEELDIEFTKKLDAVKALEKELIQMGKNVKISMC